MKNTEKNTVPLCTVNTAAIKQFVTKVGLQGNSPVALVDSRRESKVP